MTKYTLTIETESYSEILRAIGSTIGATTHVVSDEHGPAAPVQVKATDTVTDDGPTQPRQSSEPHVAEPDDESDGPDNTDPPETDVRGYKWDERIHASSKVLNKDGTWRYRRNTEQDLIDKVEAEQKDPLDIPPALQRPVDVPVPGSTAPAPVAPPVVTVTYEQVIAELTEAMKNGKIATEALPGFYRACGVPDVSGLVGNQDALDKAHERIAGL